MFDMDPYMKTGLVSFFTPAIFGCLAYWLATVLASLTSPSPRRRYLVRLIVLAVFVVTITFVFGIPNFVSTGHPDHVRMLYVREVGGKYGTMSAYVWLVFAILKYPKEKTAVS
jgi:hypothetical protein